MGLRFLNLNTHVEAPINKEFMKGLKNVLEQLSHVTNTNELKHISQNFFKESFGIMHGKTTLYIKKSVASSAKHIQITATDSEHVMAETFFASASERVLQYTRENGILIYDEIAFSNFYEETDDQTYILAFLDSIPADVFLPIYEKNEVLGYIIIERHARVGKLYSNVDRDEMIIFTNYLANIINMLHSKNVDSLLAHTKTLQEEVFRKHQEIHQYRESIRSFMRTKKQELVGILFYKNRRFTFANQAAQELIMININTMAGHPLSKAFRALANHVSNYKTSHTIDAKDINGNHIVLAGMPHLEQNQVIIMVHYPEISDLLKRQVTLLHDPSEWDYLLYLETTQSGKLINQLIPGTGATLLKFKVELLKLALSKQAVLLDDIPDQDIMPTVELLHHINLREKLHIIDLKHPASGYEIAVKLFGMHHIFNRPNQEVPLLSSLDTVGTLFIKNLHFLDRESQEHLAEFLSYGFYRTFKGSQKTAANVRVICSSDQDLYALTQENRFSATLFHELKRASLTMPSLHTLPEEELANLAEGFSEQNPTPQSLKHLFTLTDADKHRLNITRPTSLSDLRHRVQHLIAQKSKQNSVIEATRYDSEQNFSDPELVQAARLGKHALKDEQVMRMLFKKLKNQNKIAHFLGVNRSSVNRRWKEYNLE
jgi:transcriptional regulator of aromatic amino acid metabolism